jgi:hypothetical protein
VSIDVLWPFIYMTWIFGRLLGSPLPFEEGLPSLCAAESWKDTRPRKHDPT